MTTQSSFWRRCRVAFRWCRITTWLVILMLVSGFFWINQIGLPDFLKARLLENLHERGIEFNFTRMRWRVVRGIVVENARVGGTNAMMCPTLSLAEIQVKLDHQALWHRRLQLDELILHQGKLTWTLSPTNSLILNHIECQLNIETNDVWSLDHLTADFASASLSLSGKIAHASELKNWPLFHPPPSGQREPLQLQFKKISDQINRIQFDGSPKLTLTVAGDARDMDSFNVHLDLAAVGAESPWGHFREAVLAAEIRPSENLDHAPLLSASLTMAAAKTPWGRLEAGSLAVQTFVVLTNQLPPTQLQFRAASLSSPWGNASDIVLNAGAKSRTLENTNLDPALGAWTNALPFEFNWAISLSQLAAQNLSASDVTLDGAWQSPWLLVTNLAATVGNGRLKAGASLNVCSRELSFTNQSSFDLHIVEPVLTEKTRARLALIRWTQPPLLQAGGTLTLPAWTNRQPDWRREVQPTLRLDGEFAFTNSIFMQVALDTANSQFAYSNLVWHLPDLNLAQAKTRLLIDSEEDENTKSFRTRISGVFDPESARPFLIQSNAVHVMNQLSFQDPIGLDVTATGHLYDYHDLMIQGSLALTNIAYKQQTVETLTSHFLYTNRSIAFFHPEMWRAGHSQTIRADTIFWDMPGQKLLFTNGFSTTDPMVVGRSIGTKTAHVMSAYEFLTNPTARVNGCVPLRMRGNELVTDEADMRFEMLAPAPFRWHKFETPSMFGNVRWLGSLLIITNATAVTYGGRAEGWGVFDMQTKQAGTDFRFYVSAAGVNVHQMGIGLWSRTNHLEGFLSGTLKISRANSEDWQQSFGYGNATLKDGLIWEIPMFGILSPVLNSVSPGLGSSRATDAAANFIITNGVIATDSMVIHSTMSRLQYTGTIDLHENINARVTAQFLRNTPVFGDIFSLVLYPVSKIFEYEVTGSLKNPKTTPYHDVSKLLLMPLHPFHTLGELLSPDDNTTNAPDTKY